MVNIFKLHLTEQIPRGISVGSGVAFTIILNHAEVDLHDRDRTGCLLHIKAQYTEYGFIDLTQSSMEFPEKYMPFVVLEVGSAYPFVRIKIFL